MTVARLNRPTEGVTPRPVGLDAGLWSAAARGVLVVQRCDGCGSDRLPPVESCYACRGVGWSWAPVPGSGTVQSYVWIPDRARDPRDPHRSFNVAVIRVDGTTGDPVRLLSNVVDAWEPDDLRVGDRVRLRPVEISASLALPCFERLGAE